MLRNEFKPQYVLGDDNIDEVAKRFEKYNLSVIAVTGYKNRLLGRITGDDILDVIEQNATEQMYQLAGLTRSMSRMRNCFIQVKKGLHGFL